MADTDSLESFEARAKRDGMRTFDYYFVQRSVNVYVPPPADVSVVRGCIYFGHRMQTLLMGYPALNKALGLSTRDEIEALSPMSPRVTIFEFSSGNNLARIGCIAFFNFYLVPQDITKTMAPFNNKYSTGITFSRNVLVNDAVTALYNQVWAFKSGTNTVNYVVEPGSIRERRRKKNSPSFS